MTSEKKDTSKRWVSHAEEVAALAGEIRRWFEAGWLEAYAAVPDVETLKVMRRLAAALPERERADGQQEQPLLILLRVRCMQAIASCAVLWQQARSDDERRIALVTLAHNLRAADTRLWSPPLPPGPIPVGWHEGPSPQPIDYPDLDGLAERIKNYDAAPRWKDETKGVERILAEIVVLDAEPGALNFKFDEDEDPEDAIESIRKQLANASSDYLKNPAK